MAKTTWAEKLKLWRRAHEEQYAKTIMETPEQTTLMRAIPASGIALIMGARRKGKSALAHDIAARLHKSKGMPAVLHLPRVPTDLRSKIQKLLPDWMRLVTTTDQWPKKAVVIYDEAAQGAHARRTQSGEAVQLENMIGISGQRQQLVIFISHHSRKLDPNVLRDVDIIVWKEPTYAHWMFERDEFTDFTLKAVDFFTGLKTPSQRLKTSLLVDFQHLRIQQFTNGLPFYWSDQLSHLFEDIKSLRKGGVF